MINPADVREEVELQRRMFFQKPAELDDLLRWNSKRVNPVRGAEVLDGFPKRSMIGARLRDGSTLMTLQPDPEASRPARGTS